MRKERQQWKTKNEENGNPSAVIWSMDFCSLVFKMKRRSEKKGRGRREKKKSGGVRKKKEKEGKERKIQKEKECDGQRECEGERKGVRWKKRTEGY